MEDSELQDKPFTKIHIERSGDNWIYVFVKDLKFEGRCGPENLNEILQIFRNWIEKNCRAHVVDLNL